MWKHNSMVVLAGDRCGSAQGLHCVTSLEAIGRRADLLGGNKKLLHAARRCRILRGAFATKRNARSLDCRVALAAARKVDCTEEFLAANHFVSSSRNFHVPTTVFGWKAAATYVISPSRARPAICCCTRASICETKCRCADGPQRCFLGLGMMA